MLPGSALAHENELDRGIVSKKFRRLDDCIETLVAADVSGENHTEFVGLLTETGIIRPLRRLPGQREIVDYLDVPGRPVALCNGV